MNILLNRSFVSVIFAQIASLFGDAVLRFALPLYVLNQTGSAALMGAVSACAWIPYIVLTPIGGVAADRVNKRRIMAALDILLATTCAAFLAFDGVIDLVGLCICALIVLYAAQSVYQPTVQAAVPFIVTRDGIVRATNRLLCGRTIVISGYGYCGSGLALRAKGMGMRVIVCEVDPLKALEAHMEGYEVMPAAEAARFADVWVTVTGNCKVVDGPAFENMKDGAIVCNSGHFDSEINLEWLEDHATKKEEIKPLVEEYTLPDGRTVIVLAQGRLVNLSCAEGHPASVMDMSFANQALAAEYLYLHAGELENKVYDVPAAIDTHVARVKLETLGIEIDELTEEQVKYMSSWNFETL